MPNSSSVAVVGRFGKTHGLRGWIKVHSDTLPVENILHYKPWLIEKAGEWHPLDVDAIKTVGHHLIVHIKNIDDINDVQCYVSREIAVARSTWPPLNERQYYWADLVGMRVMNEKGELLGHIDHLMETGANDVLVVAGNKRVLIPFIREQVIKKVDLVQKTITVNWDADF